LDYSKVADVLPLALPALVTLKIRTAIFAMKVSRLNIILLFVPCVMSCTSLGTARRAPENHNVLPTTVLRPIRTPLKEGAAHQVLNASETAIKGKRGESFEFKRAQFISPSTGWAMTTTSLYQTTNGGKSWKRLPHDPGPGETRFNGFFFLNESMGWLIEWKLEYREHYGLGNSSVLLVTKDGGTTWETQATFPNEVRLEEIKFLNRDKGLIVGSKAIDHKPVYEEIFALSTSNGGKAWTEISEQVKNAVKNEAGIANDIGDQIYWQSPSSIFVLTRYGRVIASSDGGATWKVLVKFQDERPEGTISSTGYYKLVLDPKQRLRVLAGGDGDEGYWGDFLIEDNGTWTSYEVQRTPMPDAIFLSDTDVVACGLNFMPYPNSTSSGIVVRSFDGGRSWSPIYRSKSHERFFSLTKVDENRFYAVSDTGTFLQFSLNNN
jgi:photosystem II stability/assembly factor-like uncharacterized protein